MFYYMIPRHISFLGCVCLVGCGLLAGCNDEPVGSRVDRTDIKTNFFEGKGIITAINPAEKSVEIKHEAIVGYMGAMTMTFSVKDTNELKDLGPGDPVSFRLAVTETDGWVDHLKRTGPRTNILPTTGAFRLVRDVEPLSIGDKMPEYHFTNSFGEIISTEQFKGSALAINFLFTRCPFPTFCPRTAKLFEETGKALQSMANGPTNWHLLSITIDPEFDTPEVLRNYSRMYGSHSNYWTFATGELIDITAIGEQFGLTFWRDETSGLPNHNLRTAVIDAAGRLQNVISGNEWESPELIADMLTAAKARP